MDRNRTTIGILTAYTAFSEVYVDDLWVDKSFRDQGYGKRLLLELEYHFKGRGFKVESIRRNIKNPNPTKTFL